MIRPRWGSNSTGSICCRQVLQTNSQQIEPVEFEPSVYSITSVCRRIHATNRGPPYRPHCWTHDMPAVAQFYKFQNRACKNGSREPYRAPFGSYFFIRMLGLVMVNVCAKFVCAFMCVCVCVCMCVCMLLLVLCNNLSLFVPSFIGIEKAVSGRRPLHCVDYSFQFTQCKRKTAAFAWQQKLR